jgi:Tfp pilus assembly protein PilN
MEININLLAPKKRERIKRLIIFLFTKNILAWTVITLAIISIVLLWGLMVLIEEFQNLSESTTLVNREYSGYNQEIKEINNIIQETNKAHSNYQRITPRILEFSENLPADIKINSLNFDFKNKSIEINGLAQTRTSLLDYQEKLKEIPWIDEVVIPTNQLFKKENISFSFVTKIKE